MWPGFSGRFVKKLPLLLDGGKQSSNERKDSQAFSAWTKGMLGAGGWSPVRGVGVGELGITSRGGRFPGGEWPGGRVEGYPRLRQSRRANERAGFRCAGR